MTTLPHPSITAYRFIDACVSIQQESRYMFHVFCHWGLFLFLSGSLTINQSDSYPFICLASLHSAVSLLHIEPFGSYPFTCLAPAHSSVWFLPIQNPIRRSQTGEWMSLTDVWVGVEQVNCYEPGNSMRRSQAVEWREAKQVNG